MVHDVRLYTVHVSGVHFLQRDRSGQSEKESGIERWGTSGRDRTRVRVRGSQRTRGDRGLRVFFFLHFGTPRKLYRLIRRENLPHLRQLTAAVYGIATFRVNMPPPTPLLSVLS